MTYFTLEIHKAYKPPQITKMHGVLGEKALGEKGRRNTSKYTIFQITYNTQTVFTDIIFRPCFMVSKMVMETIKMYDPRLRFERVVLFDSENKNRAYYIPILEKLDVLTPNSRVGRDKRTLEFIEVDGKKTKGRAIFQVESKGRVYFLVSLDLIESLLRRNVVGIDLKTVGII